MSNRTALPPLREVGEKLALSAGALVVTLLFLEFVVFRFVLVPDDLLRNKTINHVVRYEPNAVAVFRHPDGNATTVRINAQGWNSRRPFYMVERAPDTLRVAVIGDSYVHAKFVEQDDSFPAVMERELKARGQHAEVYRFGMDGAPLSQYLHVLRREVLAYKPDVVVIPIVHNDFDESYRFIKTRYASSFMKLRRGEDGAVEEIPPARFEGGSADMLRASAAFRYIYYETGLYLRAKQWVSRYFWGGNEDWDPAFVSSAVDVRKIRDHASNRFFAGYVLKEMQMLAGKHGFRLVFAMDGVRDAIYSGKPVETYDVWQLNVIARELTGGLGLPLVRLHDIFAEDFARTRLRHEFSFDWHWNVRGNELVGRALVDAIARELKLPAGQEETASVRKVELPMTLWRRQMETAH